MVNTCTYGVQNACVHAGRGRRMLNRDICRTRLPPAGLSGSTIAISRNGAGRPVLTHLNPVPGDRGPLIVQMMLLITYGSSG